MILESSLYVHIPFCRKKCDYCDFYSIPSSARKADGKSLSNDLTDDYINSVVAEARFYADFYGIDHWGTIYVGGGTPSLLSPKQVENLFCGIGKAASFDEKSEVTVEMNPDDVCPGLLEACSASGVNRLSLGVQALDDSALAAVHRGCSSASARAALELLDSSWGGRLSVDFIAGLPKQTFSSFEKQFDEIFRLKKIDHISLYTLTIEDGTPLGKKVESGEVVFSFDKADRMWILGRNILERNGFMQYEVSNFSKPGFESRHNSSYWKLRNYIGCGAGASGTWYGADLRDDEALRWTNTRAVPAYVDFWKRGGGFPLEGKVEESGLLRDCERLDRRTLEFEYLMMGFRMREGVLEEDFGRRFGKSLLDYKNASGVTFSRIFSEWKKKRLASLVETSDGNRYCLNRRGILLLNRFLESLI